MTALFTLDAKIEGVDEVAQALARLDPLEGQPQFLEGLGRMIQEQTRGRISRRGPAPDGKAWTPNRTGTPLLYKSGTLSRSIDYAVAGDDVIVGSGLKYAAVHQHGATIKPKQARALVFRLGNRTIFARKVTIPARPYLGMSSDDRDDIIDATSRFIAKKLGGGP